MVTAAGLRIGWDDLPRPVRLAVEDILGDQIIDVRSQVGGFSPGTADRVVTAAGRRAFVKAASPRLNEQTVELHRREALVAAALPAEVPTSALHGSTMKASGSRWCSRMSGGAARTRRG